MKTKWLPDDSGFTFYPTKVEQFIDKLEERYIMDLQDSKGAIHVAWQNIEYKSKSAIKSAIVKLSTTAQTQTVLELQPQQPTDNHAPAQTNPTLTSQPEDNPEDNPPLPPEQVPLPSDSETEEQLQQDVADIPAASEDDLIQFSQTLPVTSSENVPATASQPDANALYTEEGGIFPGFLLVTITIIYATAKVSIDGPCAKWFEDNELELLCTQSTEEADSPTKRKSSRVKSRKTIFSPSAANKISPKKAKQYENITNNLAKLVNTLDVNISELRDEFRSVLIPLAEENEKLRSQIASQENQTAALQIELIDEIKNLTTITAKRAKVTEKATTDTMESIAATILKETGSKIQNIEKCAMANTDRTMDKLKQLSDAIKAIPTCGTNAPPIPPAVIRPQLVNIRTMKDVSAWKKQTDTVYIGRRNDTLKLKASKWQNHFRPDDCEGGIEEAISEYERYIRGSPKLMHSITELIGKQMGCYCTPNSKCHGDVLKKLITEHSTDQPTQQHSNSKSPKATASSVFPPKSIASYNMPSSSTAINTAANISAISAKSAPNNNTTNVPTMNISAKKDVRILMDSNRKHIDFSKLFPKAARVVVYECGTIPSATSKVRRMDPNDSPTDIVLHIGTNDSDDVSISAGTNAEKLTDLANEAASKFPNALIHLSELTPRKDALHAKAMDTNYTLRELRTTAFSANVRLVTNGNLQQEHLWDAKHLSYTYHKDDETRRINAPAGSMLLAGNIYAAVTNRKPDIDILLSSRLTNQDIYPPRTISQHESYQTDTYQSQSDRNRYPDRNTQHEVYQSSNSRYRY